MDQGKVLAHYRVENKVGAGGMGEVYRAHDGKLDRDVALKILPGEFAADTERVARFQREAKTLASLHHPNIASIFGFEKTDEATFLVMEFVEGEDLSVTIKRGALPVDEAVDIARQIAEGLEDAHEKGIVHRDLKPANVKRTPEGKVKILDFGLARVFAGQTTGEEEVGSAVTMTAGMTQAGTVLGTAAYMSPEQARGKEVDRRTDIWAFGVILFEMLTGRQLFAGETATDTLAGILKSEPDWDSLPDNLPPQVERVLRRCLSKDPRQRLRDIGEARVRLEDPAAESGLFTGAFTPIDDDSPPRRGLALAPWIVAGLAVAALAWALLGRGPAIEDPLVRHLGFDSPEGLEFHVGGSYPALPVVSPDGNHIVFGTVDPEAGRVDLYVRTLTDASAVRLDGTTGAQYPFWSPDSEWIGFFDRDEGLKKIRVGGGPTQLVCAAGNAKGGSWSVGGEIIFTPDYNGSIMVVPAVGGTPRAVTDVQADVGFDSHRHPEFMPDGRHFIYLARGTGGHESEIRLAALDGGEAKVVMKSPVAARYAHGQLFYTSQRNLMAQSFDPTSGELESAPVPLAENVFVVTGAAMAAFSVAESGVLTYLRGSESDAYSLLWLDANGIEGAPAAKDDFYETVVLSPDGRRAAVTILDRQAGTNDIWVLDIERKLLTRLTTNPADEAYPVWMADNRTVLFVSDRGGHYATYGKPVGGTRPPEPVFDPGHAMILWDCSDDGSTILYSVDSDSTGLDLWAADLTGETEPRAVVTTGASDGAATFSPDEKWVAYWTEESGAGQVYLAPWPAMSPVTQVSTTTGGWNWWKDDMSSLVFQDDTGRLLSADLEPAGPEMRISVPRHLFDHGSIKFEGPWLDMTGDGKRFLAIRTSESHRPVFCDVILGWPGMLPADR